MYLTSPTSIPVYCRVYEYTLHNKVAADDPVAENLCEHYEPSTLPVYTHATPPPSPPPMSAITICDY